MKKTRFLRIRDLPLKCRDEELRDVFGRYGTVQSIRLFRDGYSRHAIVSFFDVKSASQAIDADPKINDTPLKVEYCDSVDTSGYIFKLNEPSWTANDANRSSDRDRSARRVPCRTLLDSLPKDNSSRLALIQKRENGRIVNGSSTNQVLRPVQSSALTTRNPIQWRGVKLSNLPPLNKLSDEHLRQGLFTEFRRCGRIQSVDLPTSGQFEASDPTRIAIVTFRRHEEAECAYQAIHGGGKLLFSTAVTVEHHPGYSAPEDYPTKTTPISGTLTTSTTTIPGGTTGLAGRRTPDTPMISPTLNNPLRSTIKLPDPTDRPVPMETASKSPTRTLYIAGLTTEPSGPVSSEQLTTAFRKFGDILDVQMQTCSNSALIEFAEMRGPIRAMNAHSRDPLRLGGRPLSLAYVPSRSSTGLWCSDLPSSLTILRDDELLASLSRWAPVKEITLINRVDPNIRTGSVAQDSTTTLAKASSQQEHFAAYILLSSAEHASRLLTELRCGRHFHDDVKSPTSVSGKSTLSRKSFAVDFASPRQTTLVHNLQLNAARSGGSSRIRIIPTTAASHARGHTLTCPTDATRLHTPPLTTTNILSNRLHQPPRSMVARSSNVKPEMVSSGRSSRAPTDPRSTVPMEIGPPRSRCTNAGSSVSKTTNPGGGLNRLVDSGTGLFGSPHLTRSRDSSLSSSSSCSSESSSSSSSTSSSCSSSSVSSSSTASSIRPTSRRGAASAANTSNSSSGGGGGSRNGRAKGTNTSTGSGSIKSNQRNRTSTGRGSDSQSKTGGIGVTNRHKNSTSGVSECSVQNVRHTGTMDKSGEVGVRQTHVRRPLSVMTTIASAVLSPTRSSAASSGGLSSPSGSCSSNAVPGPVLPLYGASAIETLPVTGSHHHSQSVPGHSQQHRAIFRGSPSTHALTCSSVSSGLGTGSRSFSSTSSNSSTESSPLNGAKTTTTTPHQTASGLKSTTTVTPSRLGHLKPCVSLASSSPSAIRTKGSTTDAPNTQSSGMARSSPQTSAAAALERKSRLYCSEVSSGLKLHLSTNCPSVSTCGGFNSPPATGPLTVSIKLAPPSGLNQDVNPPTSPSVFSTHSEAGATDEHHRHDHEALTPVSAPPTGCSSGHAHSLTTDTISERDYATNSMDSHTANWFAMGSPVYESMYDKIKRRTNKEAEERRQRQMESLAAREKKRRKQRKKEEQMAKSPSLHSAGPYTPPDLFGSDHSDHTTLTNSTGRSSHQKSRRLKSSSTIKFESSRSRDSSNSKPREDKLLTPNGHTSRWCPKKEGDETWSSIPDPSCRGSDKLVSKTKRRRRENSPLSSPLSSDDDCSNSLSPPGTMTRLSLGMRFHVSANYHECLPPPKEPAPSQWLTDNDGSVEHLSSSLSCSSSDKSERRFATQPSNRTKQRSLGTPNGHHSAQSTKSTHLTPFSPDSHRHRSNARPSKKRSCSPSRSKELTKSWPSNRSAHATSYPDKHHLPVPSSEKLADPFNRISDQSIGVARQVGFHRKHMHTVDDDDDDTDLVKHSGSKSSHHRDTFKATKLGTKRPHDLLHGYMGKLQKKRRAHYETDSSDLRHRREQRTHPSATAFDRMYKAEYRGRSPLPYFSDEVASLDSDIDDDDRDDIKCSDSISHTTTGTSEFNGIKWPRTGRSRRISTGLHSGTDDSSLPVTRSPSPMTYHSPLHLSSGISSKRDLFNTSKCSAGDPLTNRLDEDRGLIFDSFLDSDRLSTNSRSTPSTEPMEQAELLERDSHMKFTDDEWHSSVASNSPPLTNLDFDVDYCPIDKTEQQSSTTYQSTSFSSQMLSPVGKLPSPMPDGSDDDPLHIVDLEMKLFSEAITHNEPMIGCSVKAESPMMEKSEHAVVLFQESSLEDNTAYDQLVITPKPTIQTPPLVVRSEFLPCTPERVEPICEPVIEPVKCNETPAPMPLKSPRTDTLGLSIVTGNVSTPAVSHGVSSTTTQPIITTVNPIIMSPVNTIITTTESIRVTTPDIVHQSMEIPIDCSVSQPLPEQIEESIPIAAVTLETQSTLFKVNDPGKEKKEPQEPSKPTLVQPIANTTPVIPECDKEVKPTMDMTFNLSPHLSTTSLQQSMKRSPQVSIADGGKSGIGGAQTLSGAPSKESHDITRYVQSVIERVKAQRVEETQQAAVQQNSNSPGQTTASIQSSVNLTPRTSSDGSPMLMSSTNGLLPPKRATTAQRKPLVVPTSACSPVIVKTTPATCSTPKRTTPPVISHMETTDVCPPVVSVSTVASTASTMVPDLQVPSIPGVNACAPLITSPPCRVTRQSQSTAHTSTKKVDSSKEQQGTTTTTATPTVPNRRRRRSEGKAASIPNKDTTVLTQISNLPEHLPSRGVAQSTASSATVTSTKPQFTTSESIAVNSVIPSESSVTQLLSSAASAPKVNAPVDPYEPNFDDESPLGFENSQLHPHRSTPPVCSSPAPLPLAPSVSSKTSTPPPPPVCPVTSTNCVTLCSSPVVTVSCSQPKTIPIVTASSTLVSQPPAVIVPMATTNATKDSVDDVIRDVCAGQFDLQSYMNSWRHESPVSTAVSRPSKESATCVNNKLPEVVISSPSTTPMGMNVKSSPPVSAPSKPFPLGLTSDPVVAAVTIPVNSNAGTNKPAVSGKQGPLNKAGGNVGGTGNALINTLLAALQLIPGSQVTVTGPTSGIVGPMGTGTISATTITLPVNAARQAAANIKAAVLSATNVMSTSNSENMHSTPISHAAMTLNQLPVSESQTTIKSSPYMPSSSIVGLNSTTGNPVILSTTTSNGMFNRPLSQQQFLACSTAALVQTTGTIATVSPSPVLPYTSAQALVTPAHFVDTIQHRRVNGGGSVASRKQTHMPPKDSAQFAGNFFNELGLPDALRHMKPTTMEYIPIRVPPTTASGLSSVSHPSPIVSQLHNVTTQGALSFNSNAPMMSGVQVQSQLRQQQQHTVAHNRRTSSTLTPLSAPVVTAAGMPVRNPPLSAPPLTGQSLQALVERLGGVVEPPVLMALAQVAAGGGGGGTGGLKDTASRMETEAQLVNYIRHLSQLADPTGRSCTTTKHPITDPLHRTVTPPSSVITTGVSGTHPLLVQTTSQSRVVGLPPGSSVVCRPEMVSGLTGPLYVSAAPSVTSVPTTTVPTTSSCPVQTSPNHLSGNTISQRYPLVWQGRLSLKNAETRVALHYIYGNPGLLHDCMRLLASGGGGQPQQSLVSSGGPLRIVQRMRLEPAQLEGVQRKIHQDGASCVCLALPAGDGPVELMQQTQILNDSFIRYMQEKMAAGIINVGFPDVQQGLYVVHIFPPCEFSNTQLHLAAPELLRRVIQANQSHLLVVITTV